MVHILVSAAEIQARHNFEAVSIQTGGSHSRVVRAAAPVDSLASHFLDRESFSLLERCHGQSLSLFLFAGCCILCYSLRLPSLVVAAEEDRISISAKSFRRLRPQRHHL